MIRQLALGRLGINKGYIWYIPDEIRPLGHNVSEYAHRGRHDEGSQATALKSEGCVEEERAVESESRVVSAWRAR